MCMCYKYKYMRIVRIRLEWEWECGEWSTSGRSVIGVGVWLELRCSWSASGVEV